jgi:hypothetical protein
VRTPGGPGDRRSTSRYVARAVAAPTAVVHKEVSRLIDAGVLIDSRQGHSRLVRANPEYRLLRPLTELIAGTYGPEPVASNALRGIGGVEMAYIYGSWAARYDGETGAQPRDLDVLVIGTAARAELNETSAAAEERLRMPVTITKVSREAWHAGDDAFLKTVRSRPLVRLDLGTEVTA